MAAPSFALSAFIEAKYPVLLVIMLAHGFQHRHKQRLIHLHRHVAVGLFSTGMLKVDHCFPIVGGVVPVLNFHVILFKCDNLWV